MSQKNESTEQCDTIPNPLNDAYASGNTTEIIRLVSKMALSVTRGDEEAAEAATDEVLMTVAKGTKIDNFSAWALAVIKRTAWKVWKARRQGDLSIDGTRHVSLIDSIEAMLSDAEWDRNSDAADDWIWEGSKLENYEDYFPSPDAYRAFCMQVNGKSPAEIAAEFGVKPGAMRVRMHRWEKQTAKRYQKQRAVWHRRHLAYAAKRKSEGTKKYCVTIPE